ncbi:MAG: hypothetical protein ABIO94_06910 [Opitutaceae bacterium]
MPNQPNKVLMALKDLRTGLPVKILGVVENSHELFTLPPEDTVLWRFVNYDRFKSLLTDRKLYFRRADKFKDILEGRFTEANRERPSKMFAAIAAHVTTADLLPIQESHRSHVYVNCWHKNPVENLRMWSEYSTGPEAIAVKTDLVSLFRSTTQEIKASNVHYVEESYSIPEFHSLSALVHKRREKYEFENELRLIYQLSASQIERLDNKGDEGRLVPVNAQRLIHLIRFHPSASTDFKDRVQRDACAASLVLNFEDSAFSKLG